MSVGSRMIGKDSPAWFGVQADTTQVSYTDVNNQSPVTFNAVASAPQTVVRISDTGHRQRVRIREIVFLKGASLDWGGVANPELDASFTINGEKWRIDTDAENGVRSTTGTFHKIALKSGRPMGQAYPGMIEQNG